MSKFWSTSVVRLIVLSIVLRTCGSAFAQQEFAAQQEATTFIPTDNLGPYELHPIGAGFLPFPPLPDFEENSDWRWTLLPKGVLYSTYLAGTAEPRLSVEVLNEADQGRLVDSSIGGRIPLVRFGSRESKEGWQFDLLGGAKLRQDPEEELDVLASDFRFDLPITYRKDSIAIKLGYYHVSSHAGDEFLLKNPGFQRLNFLRDTIVFGYSWFMLDDDLRLYSEVGYAFNSEVSEPWELQFGIDFAPSDATGIRGAPFIALNGHLREELDFGGNFAMQLGWAWRGEGHSAGLFRTGLYVYNGGSSQFSFYQENEQQVGWGLWYDF